MRGEVVPSRPDMSRSMAISAKIPSVMSVELIPAKTVHTGLRKFRNGAYLGSGPTFGSRFKWVRKKIAPERFLAKLTSVHNSKVAEEPDQITDKDFVSIQGQFLRQK